MPFSHILASPPHTQTNKLGGQGRRPTPTITSMKRTLTTLATLTLTLGLTACSTDTPSDDAIACGYLLAHHDGTMEGAKKSMQTLSYFDDKIEDPDIKDKWEQASEDGTFLQFNPGVEYDMWYVQLSNLVDLCEEAGHEPRN